jgi:hypothetical protein
MNATVKAIPTTNLRQILVTKRILANYLRQSADQFDGAAVPSGVWSNHDCN